MSIVLKQQTYGYFFFFIRAKSSRYVYYIILFLFNTRCGTICGQIFFTIDFLFFLCYYNPRSKLNMV